MELHQVRYFLAVAKHLNLTRAAEDLRIAQPSLTRAIQRLEAELEGPLFRRERSRTHLTDLGRTVLPHLEALHVAAETAKAQARRLGRGGAGGLCLGVCTGIEPTLPARLVLDTVGRFPDLQVSVEVASTEIVERRLMAGDFDAAILAPAGACHDRFDLREIHDEELVVAFADGHRFAGLASVPVEALAGEPLVVRLGCRHEQMLARLMEARGLERLVRHRVEDPLWLADFVRGGQGCAVVAATLALSHALAHRTLDGVPLRFRTVLATVAGRRHSPALASLAGRITGSRRP